MAQVMTRGKVKSKDMHEKNGKSAANHLSVKQSKVYSSTTKCKSAFIYDN